jgi:hypothetical protein
MRDVLDVFDGRFKAQQSANMHWLPVPPEKVRTNDTMLDHYMAHETFCVAPTLLPEQQKSCFFLTSSLGFDDGLCNLFK